MWFYTELIHKQVKKYTICRKKFVLIDGELHGLREDTVKGQEVELLPLHRDSAPLPYT